MNIWLKKKKKQTLTLFIFNTDHFLEKSTLLRQTEVFKHFFLKSLTD